VIAVLSDDSMCVLVEGYRRLFLESCAPESGPLWGFRMILLIPFFAGHARFCKLRRDVAGVI
jgi:hypothetical protein